MSNSLCEKCPNTESFLVVIFPYSDKVRENTNQKKLRIWTLFTQWLQYIYFPKSLEVKATKQWNLTCQWIIPTVIYLSSRIMETLVPDLFLFFKKALNEVKANDPQHSFSIFQQPSIWHIIKTNCIKRCTIDQEMCSIFDCLEKVLGIVFPPHFPHFLKKQKTIWT